MATIDCPALRNDDTLGFLAGLGLLELCTTALGLPGARLRWTGLGGHAVLEADCAGLGDLVDRLAALATEMRQAGRVLPFDHTGIVDPPASDAERKRMEEERGVKPPLDPLKRDGTAALALYRAVGDGEPSGDAVVARWVLALLNQLADARSAAKEPTRALTPLYSPAGRMTVHQLFRDALDDVVRQPERLREALVAWERTDGTGANIDGRALRDAAVTAGGGAANRAVPGATWLALMAIPLFRQTGSAPPGRAEVVGWDLRSSGGATLRWPAWRPPLDLAAVEVLLAHPAIAVALQQANNGEPRWRAARRRRAQAALRALGVEAICTARRRPLEKSAGALRPPRVVPVP